MAIAYFNSRSESEIFNGKNLILIPREKNLYFCGKYDYPTTANVRAIIKKIFEHWNNFASNWLNYFEVLSQTKIRDKSILAFDKEFQLSEIDVSAYFLNEIEFTFQEQYQQQSAIKTHEKWQPEQEISIFILIEDYLREKFVRSSLS